MYPTKSIYSCAAVALLAVCTYAVPVQAADPDLTQLHTDQNPGSPTYDTHDQHNRDGQAMNEKTRLTVTGTVDATSSKALKLDTGNGTVNVDMSGWDWYQSKWGQLKGQTVTITCQADGSLFGSNSIQPDSIYIKKMGVVYCERGADHKRGMEHMSQLSSPPESGKARVQGRVSSINGKQVVLNSGSDQITIDASDADNSPLDNNGYQLKPGDYVIATGELSSDFLSSKKFSADTLIAVQNDGGSPNARNSDMNRGDHDNAQGTNMNQGNYHSGDRTSNNPGR